MFPCRRRSISRRRLKHQDNPQPRVTPFRSSHGVHILAVQATHAALVMVLNLEVKVAVVVLVGLRNTRDASW